MLRSQRARKMVRLWPEKFPCHISDYIDSIHSFDREINIKSELVKVLIKWYRGSVISGHTNRTNGSNSEHHHFTKS